MMHMNYLNETHYVWNNHIHGIDHEHGMDVLTMLVTNDAVCSCNMCVLLCVDEFV